MTPEERTCSKDLQATATRAVPAAVNYYRAQPFRTGV